VKSAFTTRKEQASQSKIQQEVNYVWTRQRTRPPQMVTKNKNCVISLQPPQLNHWDNGNSNNLFEKLFSN